MIRFYDGLYIIHFGGHSMNNEEKSSSSKNKIAKNIAFIGVVLIVCTALGVITISLLSKASSASSSIASSPPGGVSSDAAVDLANNVNNTSTATLALKVDIPCPGHAPLITGELKKIYGVVAVKFNWPNKFDVVYDTAKTSKQEILALNIFNEYPAIAIPRL
jgi:copper chaperone CopZ